MNKKRDVYQREGTGETIERHEESDRIVEQNGRELLIIEKVPQPFETYDYQRKRKVKIFYDVINRTLRDRDDWTSVIASEVSYWTKKEGDQAIEKGLFNYFRLFP